MGVLKKMARNIGFPLIHNLGAERIVNKAPANATLNVMYHGVVTSDKIYSRRNISAQQFEKHLLYFLKNFEIRSLADSIAPSNKQGEKRFITISLDDGYLNNLTVLLPLLKKYNIPATVYALGHIATENQISTVWSNYIDLYFENNEIDELNKIIGKTDFLSLNDYYKYVKKLSRSELKHILKSFEKKLKTKSLFQTNFDPNDYALLSSNELVQLAKSPLITIGSHCHWHCNMANQTENDQIEELKNSKENLESLIQKQVNSVAYPDGSYTRKTIDLAEQVGYTDQWAVNYQHEADREDPRIRSRFGVSCTTTFESNMFFLNQKFNKYHF